MTSSCLNRLKMWPGYSPLPCCAASHQITHITRFQQRQQTLLDWSNKKREACTSTSSEYLCILFKCAYVFRSRSWGNPIVPFISSSDIMSQTWTWLKASADWRWRVSVACPACQYLLASPPPALLITAWVAHLASLPSPSFPASSSSSFPFFLISCYNTSLR